MGWWFVVVFVDALESAASSLGRSSPGGAHGSAAAEAVSGTAVRGAGGAGAGRGKVGASVEGAAVVRTLVSTWMAAPGTNTSAKGDGHGISKTQ